MQWGVARLAANLSRSGNVAAVSAVANQRRWVSMSLEKKKIWDVDSFLVDHRTVLFQLPNVLLAYVGPNSINPQLNEAIMVAMNSVNQCSYCSGLHGELARIAGVEDVDALMAASTDTESRKVVDEQAISYARVFAECNGRGEKEATAFSAISKQYGEGEANSIRALCWFLQWGSVGGNTLNANFADWRERPLGMYELFFTVYYGPLFAAIAGMNFGLKHAPALPDAVLSTIGVALTVTAGTWVAPVGIASTFYLSPK